MTAGNTHQQQHRNVALDSTFYLGDWLADPALNLIVDRSSGEQRHLEPRLMKLLCVLAANPGAVISRDELVAQLWPRVIVNENSLTRAVSDLRKQLDAPATPARRAVQTIPKRGYRLGVEVRDEAEGELSHQAKAQQPSAAAPTDHSREQASSLGRLLAGASTGLRQQPRRLVSAGIAASLCLLLAISIFTQPPATVSSGPEVSFSDELVFSRRDFTDPRFTVSATQLSPLTADVDQPVEEPVLSPDRQRFAFIRRDLSASSIHLGHLDRMSSDYKPVEVLSVPYRLSNLTWSPVGNALLFARQSDLSPAVVFDSSDSNLELMRLDLDSGTVTRLVDDEPQAAESSAPESNLT